MTHTTSEILDLAADDIQRNGWTRGDRGMLVKGPHCTLGAIAHTVGSITSYHSHDEGMRYNMVSAAQAPATVALIDHLGLRAEGTLTLPAWNDALNREGWEVIAALRAAAAIERVKETSTEKVSA